MKTTPEPALLAPDTLPVDELTSDIGTWLPDELPPLDDDTEPLPVITDEPNVQGRLSNYLWQLRLGRFTLEPVNGGRFVVAFAHGVSDSTLRQLRASLLTVASFDLRRVVVSVPSEWTTAKFTINKRMIEAVQPLPAIIPIIWSLKNSDDADCDESDWRKYDQTDYEAQAATFDQDAQMQAVLSHDERRAETAEAILEEVRAALGIVKGDDVVEAAKAAAESARVYQTALEEIATLQVEHLRATWLDSAVQSHRRAFNHLLTDQRVIGVTTLQRMLRGELAKSEAIDAR